MTPTPVILIVEDDESDIIFLKRAFRKIEYPHPLPVAETGRRAVDYLSGTGDYADRAAFPLPTHILMDLKLPEKSGLEILEWMRGRPECRGIHVSILTSSSETRDLNRAKELGAECYLVKPMSFALLTELTRSIELWVRTGQIPAADQWSRAKGVPARP